MNRREPEDTKLRDAFAEPGGDAVVTSTCPADEQIWAASRGELPEERVKQLLAHSLECAACRESWKLAGTLAEEAGLGRQATVVPFRATRRRIVPLLAAAAVLILVFFLIPLMQRSQLPESVVPTWAAGVRTTLWRVADGSDEPLAGGDRVQPGDRIYLTLDSEVPVHVYLINRDRTGESTALFPIEGAQWSNPLPAGATHRLPGDTGWQYDSWEVSSAAGQESFIVVASAEPLAELESALALLGAAAPDQEFLRGQDLPPRDAERDPGPGESALTEALQQLSIRTPTDPLILRQIVLENPR